MQVQKRYQKNKDGHELEQVFPVQRISWNWPCLTYRSVAHPPMPLLDTDKLR